LAARSTATLSRRPSVGREGLPVDHRFSVRSTSRQTADIREPLVVSLRANPDGSIARRLVLGSCIENEKNPAASVALRIRHQRRARLASEWEEPDQYGPAQLKP